MKEFKDREEREEEKRRQEEIARSQAQKFPSPDEPPSDKYVTRAFVESAFSKCMYLTLRTDEGEGEEADGRTEGKPFYFIKFSSERLLNQMAQVTATTIHVS